MHAPSGILLVDKPSGPTSRDVSEAVGRVMMPGGRRRRGDNRFRVGHAGTLDPLATGLLVILVGRATRLQPFLQGLDKRYTATVRLGTSTDSLDRDGEVDGTAPVPATADGLAAAVAGLTGDIMQEPPIISAIKRGGRSLHHLAREGRDVAPPPARRIRIDRFETTAVRWGETPDAEAPGFLAPDGLVYEIDVDVSCGSGTYIRSLARDLARALGTVGHIHALRRLDVGPFSVTDAVDPDTLSASDRPVSMLRPPVDALPHVPVFEVEPARAAAIRNGVQPEADWLPGPAPDLFRLVDVDGFLAAIGRRDSESGGPRTVVVFPLDDDRPAEDDACE